MNELYFCLRGTENEHGIIEGEILDECRKHGCEMVYYRKLKEGHIPLHRECKVVGNGPSFNRLKAYILTLDPIGNPYKVGINRDI